MPGTQRRLAVCCHAVGRRWRWRRGRVHGTPRGRSGRVTDPSVRQSSHRTVAAQSGHSCARRRERLDEALAGLERRRQTKWVAAAAGRDPARRSGHPMGHGWHGRPAACVGRGKRVEGVVHGSEGRQAGGGDKRSRGSEDIRHLLPLFPLGTTVLEPDLQLHTPARISIGKVTTGELLKCCLDLLVPNRFQTRIQ